MGVAIIVISAMNTLVGIITLPTVKIVPLLWKVNIS